MNTPLDFGSYEKIYGTDLVYVSGCWQLCGDAHCCSFARYKSRFKMIARTPFQELPLLPGEYAFLDSKGWLGQFGDHDHKVVEFPINGYALKAESIVSRRLDCACDHDIRPTICRLYPLLPLFNIQGGLVGTGPMGIFEELERIAGMSTACQLNAMPFEELNKFLMIADEIGSDPLRLFYMGAYDITKRHVSERIAARHEQQKRDVFSSFEAAFIRQKLIDTDGLTDALSQFARQFEACYGERFVQAMNSYRP